MLIEQKGLGFGAVIGNDVDIVVENTPSLGLTRLGWEHYDLVVVDMEAAKPSVRSIVTDFLRQHNLPYMFLTAGSGSGSGNGVPSLERSRPQDFAAKVEHVLQSL